MKEYCTILIIDDEFIMRQGMKHMMDWEENGFQIIGEASNGQEGLDMIKQHKPNIILSDIVTPVMDGMDFTKIVQQKYPEIQIIILSSYDNFEYVKSTLLSGAADYILKPTLNPKDLLAVLKRAASRIPGLTLCIDKEVNYGYRMERYLLGFDPIFDKAIFEPLFPNICYRLFGINLKQNDSRHREVNHIVKSKIEDFFNGIEEYNHLSIFLNDEILCCIINYRFSDEEQLILNLRNLVKEINRIEEHSFFVLGQKFSYLEEIKEVYQQDFLPNLDRFFYAKDIELMRTDTDCWQEKEMYRFDFKKFTNYLNEGLFESAFQLLQIYVSAAINNKMDWYKLKNLTKNLLYNIIVTYESKKISTNDLKQQCFILIDQAMYAQDFMEAFTKIIATMKIPIADGMYKNDERMQEILNYIEEHYKETMDLAEVAKVFNFNYNYLSTYFNSNAKEGFSEYLNRIRIKKAGILLQAKVLPISDISAAVGYSDHSYFCRVFKKMTGETPSHYRRHHEF